MQTFWAVLRKRKTSSEAIELVMTVSIAVSVGLAPVFTRGLAADYSPQPATVSARPGSVIADADISDNRAHDLRRDADALYRKGFEADDDVALAAAVERYRVLLTLQLREHVPLDWATTQDALGNTLRRLGARESGTVRLEQAVAAYRAALQERTRGRVPLDWAATEVGLGFALVTLGERAHGTGRLEEAIGAFRGA